MSCPHKSTPDFAIRGRLHRHLWFGGLLPMYIYPFGCPLKSTPDFPMCRRFHRHLWLWGLLPTYMCDKYSYHSRPLVAHSAPLQLQINLHLNRESPTGPLCYALNREWSFDLKISLLFEQNDVGIFDVASCIYNIFWRITMIYRGRDANAVEVTVGRFNQQLLRIFVADCEK